MKWEVMSGTGKEVHWKQNCWVNCYNLFICTLRILTPQKWLFWGPRPLLYRFKPLHWRVQGFLGYEEIHPFCCWEFVFCVFFPAVKPWLQVGCFKTACWERKSQWLDKVGVTSQQVVWSDWIYYNFIYKLYNLTLTVTKMQAKRKASNFSHLWSYPCFKIN